ncbi:hypothetical protein BOTBODRAFT_436172 [Botryobasidium botryosum FD-172 SS1]|uniref:J domain-containing protein n=1 Tax=Botryobasidium botryosum (strain FD-172 SS1) TaxID=930990 RepID=A0A067N5G8_BOTB1|nr:hypothetical protein BOTBODRAFT_436172 [Botryobasidium botryosum FD-172 SS1]
MFDKYNRLLSKTMRDHYAVLGVNNGAGERELKQAFKALALKWHPDRHNSNKEEAARKFMEVCPLSFSLSQPLCLPLSPRCPSRIEF